MPDPIPIPEVNIPKRVTDRVTDKLREVLNDPDELSLVLYFLATQKDNPMFLQILEDTLDSTETFRRTVDRMLKDIQMVENNESYGRTMVELWQKCALPDTGDGQKFDLSLILSNPQRTVSAVSFSLARILSKMPAAEQAQMMNVAYNVSRSLVGQPGAVAVMDTSSALVQVTTRFGKVVPVVIVGIQLSYDMYVNIRKWWRGEISGKRCVKNIIDCATGLAGGVAGGFGGAALGTAVLPGVGTLVGGIVGGIVGCEAASRLCNLLTLKIFDLPKSEALDKSYAFVGLSASASNGEVNTRTRQLALTHHPDKPGGTNEKFQLLQSHVSVIKVAREEKAQLAWNTIAASMNTIAASMV